MGVEKVTQMVLKVNLQCPRCYKKIKKILCKIPQIRDQVYDEKANTVRIKVVCCSPEKIRDKLCAKGGKIIESIEIIKEPAKPPKPDGGTVVIVTEKGKDAKKPEDKSKDAKKPEDKSKDAKKPEDKPKANGKGDKPKVDGAPPAEKPAEKGPKAAEQAKPAAHAAKGPEPVPANGVPSVFPYCGPTYDAFAAGPYYGHGFPPPPPQPCYEGYYGYGYAQPVYGHAHGHGNGYGYGRGGYVTRSDGYFSEENPQTCSIM